MARFLIELVPEQVILLLMSCGVQACFCTLKLCTAAKCCGQHICSHNAVSISAQLPAHRPHTTVHIVPFVITAKERGIGSCTTHELQAPCPENAREASRRVVAQVTRPWLNLSVPRMVNPLVRKDALAFLSQPGRTQDSDSV